LERPFITDHSTAAAGSIAIAQIDGGDLILQRLRAGADHDLAPDSNAGTRYASVLPGVPVAGAAVESRGSRQQSIA